MIMGLWLMQVHIPWGRWKARVTFPTAFREDFGEAGKLRWILPYTRNCRMKTGLTF